MALLDHFLQLLGGAANAVGNDVQQGVHQLLGQANSINPLVAQPALSPESLRPNQTVNSYQAPYNVNGNQPSVGWKPNFPQQHINPQTIPHLLGQPDYTVERPNTDWQNPRVAPDSPIMQFGPMGPARARFIPNAAPQPVYVNEEDQDQRARFSV